LAASDASCVFCSIAAGALPAAMVFEEPDVVGFLDRRPVFKGHVLVVPRAHVASLADLPDALVEPVFGAARRCALAMPVALGSQGAWLSLNDIVSQSVPHLHVHVVPRTKGDGLRGFFWPRTKYADDDEMAAYAARLAAALRG
jgi:histidine triad (HIT) family protein